MDKNILEQYIELKGEIQDLQDRIDKDERRLAKIEKEGVVSDTVKGTRTDGTFGSIRITGYPLPEHDRVKSMIKKRVTKLHILEDDLQNAINEVDDFIEKVPKSDLRMIFRFRYLDDMTWAAVALNMNERFPKRRTKYTEDSCRMRHDRYMENNFNK
ncbi:hypothetical protein [Blautia massiliensis (ex Durand et al. 2017)]|jgi:hypothetical protein|uniref:hypothetical protein n=1 Tax=Blautia massiliensis (ex Durand et al. 2017) TaxID=1737424 RepID=UPI0022DEFB88|nr:hypothetical protein [Blautia massiliensis (ex Durand et al. 2017)]